MDVIPMLVFPVCWDDVGLNNKLYMYMFTLVTGHLISYHIIYHIYHIIFIHLGLDLYRYENSHNNT